MCADTTTSPMRRTQEIVTDVPGLYSLLSATFVILAKARIHALTPRGKTSIANPGTTNAVNVARGLVPRQGLPSAGSRSDQPSGLATNTNDPRRGGFQTRLGRRKMATPAGRPLRHSVAPTSSYPRRRESTHQSPTVKRRSKDRESLTRSM